jgi:hypothetical protein
MVFAAGVEQFSLDGNHLIYSAALEYAITTSLELKGTKENVDRKRKARGKGDKTGKEWRELMHILSVHESTATIQQIVMTQHTTKNESTKITAVPRACSTV